MTPHNGNFYPCEEVALLFFLPVFCCFPESNVAAARQYSINIAQMTQANDGTRAAAETAYQEGKQLYQQGTAESLVKAIAKFEQALQLYRQGNTPDRQKLRSLEADTLSYIAKIYSELGEKQKALSYYNQALSLYRQVGDKSRKVFPSIILALSTISWEKIKRHSHTTTNLCLYTD